MASAITHNILVVLAAGLLASCSYPSGQTAGPTAKANDISPKEISISAPPAVKASWAPSPKGKPHPRIETAAFTPFKDSVFDIHPFHPFNMPMDSEKLDLYAMPSVPLDPDQLPVRKVRAETVLMGKPQKVKAGTPAVEDKFVRGFMTMGQDQGLPGTAVVSMVQDQTGRMWMMTDNGLSLFNGEYIYTWRKRDGLSRDQKNTLCIDKKGHIWAAGGGVDEIIPEEGIIRHYGKKEGLTTNSAAAAVVDSKGRICIVGNEGLDILDPEKQTVVHIGKKEGLNVSFYVNDVMEDREGRYWLAGNGGGVSVYDPSKKKLYTITDKQGLSNNDVRAVMQDDKGNFWLGGWNGGIDILDLKKNIFYHLRRKHGLAFHYIYSIMQDHKGKVWVAYHAAGVDVIDPAARTISHVYGKEGIPKSAVICLLEDRNHCIWMGSNGGGVLRYDPSVGDIYNYESKWWYTGAVIRGLLEDAEGKVWLSTSGMGLDIYDPSQRSLKHFEMSRDWTDAFQNMLMDDGRGRIIMASDYRFTIYDKKTNKIFSWGEDEGLINSGIRSFGFHGHEIILGSKGGFEKFDPEESSFMQLETPEDPFKVAVSCLTVGKDGKVWAGTFGSGLYCFDPQAMTLSHYGAAQGFPNNPINTVLADHENKIWVGTMGDGLKKLDPQNNKLTTIGTENGLAEATVTSLLEKENRIYAGTAKGLSVIESGKEQTVIRNYDKPQGFRARDFNERSGMVASDGQLWWGIGDMLTIYKPAQEAQAASPVSITGIDLNDKEQTFGNPGAFVAGLDARDTVRTPARDTFYFKSAFRPDTAFLKRAGADWSGVKGAYNLPEQLKLPYHLDHITFHFTGNHLSNPDKTQYRYILEGNDREWNPEVSMAFADYRNLPPGNYTFRVSSRNYDGAWSEPAELSFTILPPWWRTTAAYVLYGLCFVGSVFGYNRLRTRQLLTRQKELEQNVKERTKEIAAQKSLVEEKQKEIVDSINYAKRIQFTLLAHEKVMKKHFSDHFVLFRPKDIVSGDFYWATRMDNRFYLAVCDSTGHGVPGAFMSLLNINFLNEAIIEKKIVEPNLVLDYVRDRLIKSISREGGQDGMDGILICVEENEGGVKTKITYAAANNNPVLCTPAGLGELPANKMPIGKGERMMPFELHEIKASTGDMLYLYTDGFADQFGGPSGKKFKYKKLNEILQKNAGLDTGGQHDALKKALDDWIQGIEQVDDICVIGLRL